MTNYGIKLVSAGWNNDNVIGFSERGQQRFGEQVPPGTLMLLYETASPPPGVKAKGAKSIVGAVRVTGTFEQGEALRGPTEHHAHLIPVEVVRGRDEKAIPLDRVRAIIGDDQWPRRGEAWKALEKSIYEQLIAELG